MLFHFVCNVIAHLALSSQLHCPMQFGAKRRLHSGFRNILMLASMHIPCHYSSTTAVVVAGVSNVGLYCIVSPPYLWTYRPPNVSPVGSPLFCTFSFFSSTNPIMMMSVYSPMLAMMEPATTVRARARAFPLRLRWFQNKNVLAVSLTSMVSGAKRPKRPALNIDIACALAREGTMTMTRKRYQVIHQRYA